MTLSTPSHPVAGAKPDDKLIELDAVRGFAALTVFNGHYFYTLTPAIGEALRPTPAFFLLNGGGAVMLFFVLSGFVLTLQPLCRGDARLLAAPALRRWPRLAGPVLAAALLYVCAARTGAFPKAAWFAHAAPHFPPALFWGRELNDSHPGPVLWEAGFGAFLNGAARHNPVLWTMSWELCGSFAAFALALCLVLRIPTRAKAATFSLLALIVCRESPWLVGFPAGVAAAAFHLRYGRGVTMTPKLAVLIWIAVVPVLSWDIGKAAGPWIWTERLRWDVRIYLWAACQTLAALAVMATAIYCPAVRRVLTTAPARFAGAMSFPLYLTHCLTVLSGGAWMCFVLFPAGVKAEGAVLLYIPVLAACCLVAWPVLVFDRWWVRLLASLSHQAVGTIVVRRPSREVRARTNATTRGTAALATNPLSGARIRS